MKGRKPSDPTSWFFQAAIHSVTPEAVAAALAQDPAVASVDRARFWNQCPHYGQNSADFLIWHRAYVYYFERILREASGDTSLSLPYWNYTDPNHRTFPPEFADPETDLVSGSPQNPLYDHRREQAFAFGMYQLTEQVAGTAVIFAEPDFFGASEDTGLAGGVADQDGRTRGKLERQPHDLLHFAIGGSIGTGEVDTGDGTAGSMASVTTAAFDPIFWIHHSNIDRLWAAWECQATARWGSVPAVGWLDARPWFFNDTGAVVQNLPRRHFLDRRNLDFLYDSDSAGCSPLAQRDPLPTSAPAVTPSGPGLASTTSGLAVKAEAGSKIERQRVTPDAAVTIEIPLRTMPELGGRDARSVFTTAGAGKRRLVMEIEGLQIEGITSVGYDVFVNAPAGEMPKRDSPNYVGTVAMFGFNHVHAGHLVENQHFDITKLASLAGFDPHKLSVMIVPFDLLEPLANRQRLRRAVGIHYDGVRVQVVSE